MKTYTKEIEALKNIEHTPEEIEELSRIDKELADIEKRQDQLKEEREQLNREYNRTMSKSREDKITARLHEIRKERETINRRKDNLIFYKEDIFSHVKDLKDKEEKKRLEEVVTELFDLDEKKKIAFGNYDRDSLDEYIRQEKEAEVKKAVIKKAIEDNQKAVSPMQKATDVLRKKILKETAAEVVKLFDQLEEIMKARDAEETEIKKIENEYNYRSAGEEFYVSFYDPYRDLKKILSNNKYQIQKFKDIAGE